MKRINNYQFQQQSKRKRDYEKLKKAKETAKKMPVSASEEIEYMKKLLNGEDVGNFKDEPEPMPEIQWSNGSHIDYITSKGIWFLVEKTRT
jgi:hypothetical protein